MDTTRRAPRPTPIPGRDRPSRAPAAAAALLAVAALVLVAVAPASSAVVDRTWRASVGARGAYGSVTVVALASGTGTVTLRLRSLPKSAMTSVTLRAGTCAKPGSVAAALAAIRSTRAGVLTRSVALTRTATSRLKGARTAIVQIRASGLSRCASLALASSATPSPAAGIVMDARDFAFSPGTLTAAAGKPIVISFRNDDAGVPHGMNVGTSRSLAPIAASAVITGVSRTTFTIPALADGTYTIWCPIHASMSATLIVGSGAASASATPTATVAATETPEPTMPTAPPPPPTYEPPPSYYPY